MSHQVIVHDEMGVYLGSCLGLGFWSKLDMADQDSAVCFPSAASVLEYIREVEDPTAFDGIRTVAVTPDAFDRGEAYITLSAMREQGLGEFLPTLH